MAELTTFLKKIPKLSGVYRFFDDSNHLIYVGKAKNLYKRVNSYFQKKAHDTKTMYMVTKVKRIEFTVTSSDYDAFILESNLIKKHKPHYNIFFKDDKSYPYIVISKDQFPRVFGFRGKVDKKNDYFGPYPSLSSVKDTLSLLQKLFPIRQCQNSYYKLRTRPCLQYQIKRCLAPCVGLTTASIYQVQVDLLKQFLDGKLTQILAFVSQKMHQASDSEDYELAIRLRDQLMLLRRLQEQQHIENATNQHIDIIGVAIKDEFACIVLLSVRHGSLIGDRNWIVKLSLDQSDNDLIDHFIAQQYLSEHRNNFYPHEVILPDTYRINDTLISAVSQLSNKKMQWLKQPKGLKKKWQNLAKINAEQKLKIESISQQKMTEYLDAISSWLKLKARPQRIECIDISHFQGEVTVASCVVFSGASMDKSQYRHYNIEGVRSGDDYAAIAQTVKRRVKSALEKDNFPDILIIDGGKGQLKEAEKVLTAYQLKDKIKLLSLAKGKERISGKEDIYLYSDQAAVNLPAYDPAFLLLRRIRDEAHRFAITHQRKKFSKAKRQSLIEAVPGVGAKRRQALLDHFGGWQELSKASVYELSKVPGISQSLAEKILNHLKQ
ncbi:excinuclease ABC subunit UvrC [Thiotrichales bacterium 19S3-7]|nr:excinuclease ABC subunit UvrC [Thiotrichales bacterium 19S3-7]MCF6800886.1 excinuclease ABC subunit UvrC [Thiotrichales bacterium 19S3-11]